MDSVDEMYFLWIFGVVVGRGVYFGAFLRLAAVDVWYTFL